jgi:hypothetical protein
MFHDSALTFAEAELQSAFPDTLFTIKPRAALHRHATKSDFRLQLWAEVTDSQATWDSEIRRYNYPQLIQIMHKNGFENDVAKTGRADYPGD